MSAQLEPRRFNVSEYYQMAAAGILKPDDRVELIAGEIIKMSPIGSPHAACVAKLAKLFQTIIGEKAIVWVQNPIRLNNFSEPVPDLALLKPRTDYYASQHPTPEDVLLVVEVADTSLPGDRNIKMPLYASAGLTEVWLVNLAEENIEVFSKSQDGQYLKCQKHKPGDIVESPTVTGVSLEVNVILG